MLVAKGRRQQFNLSGKGVQPISFATNYSFLKFKDHDFGLNIHPQLPIVELPNSQHKVSPACFSQAKQRAIA